MRVLAPACLSVSLAILAVGCNPAGPSSNPPAVTATVVATASTAQPVSSSQAKGTSCPAPKHSTDACAAVMTYVKVDGVCCTYGDPCSAPPGKAYDDDRCTRPR